jgi:hypothetical protein
MRLPSDFNIQIPYLPICTGKHKAHNLHKAYSLI